MNTHTTSLAQRLRLFGFGLGLVVAGVLPAAAGELNLSWSPSHDEVTAGYELEVLGADGNVDHVIDAHEATQVTVPGLADGTVYRFRVRPYDQWGNKASVPSAEIATMAAPRIDALERYAAKSDTATFTLVGANFAPGARAVPTRGGITVTSAAVKSTTEVEVTIRNATGTGMPMASDFLVVNPVRMSEQFLLRHPELLDVNHDGTVDQADLDLIRKAFGAASTTAPARTSAGKARREARAPEATVNPAEETAAVQTAYNHDLDVNGDGVVDGADAAAVQAHLSKK